MKAIEIVRSSAIAIAKIVAISHHDLIRATSSE